MNSRTVRTIMLLAVLCVLLPADTAWAWGPVTHVVLGKSILGSLGALPAAIALLLNRHRIAYLYGNIAADIVFAKRLSRVKQSCHHWSTALRLLDTADDEEGRAFAYGYLSHLAADTVAHGKYVPRQVAVSGTSVNFGHLYWELRADAAKSDQGDALLKDVIDRTHNRHHAMLACHLTGTLLSYDMNRFLFQGINALSVNRQFRRTVDVWSRCSRWHLSPALLDGYLGECQERIVSILRDGTRSAVLRDDPNGTSAFMHLRADRREFRRLKRRGLPVDRRIQEVSQSLAPKRPPPQEHEVRHEDLAPV